MCIRDRYCATGQRRYRPLPSNAAVGAKRPYIKRVRFDFSHLNTESYREQSNIGQPSTSRSIGQQSTSVEPFGPSDSYPSDTVMASKDDDRKKDVRRQKMIEKMRQNGPRAKARKESPKSMLAISVRNRTRDIRLGYVTSLTSTRSKT